jgi:hypothetical protein
MLRLPTFRRLENARERRMVCLVVVLWTLALADLFFTLWAHFFTPFYEMNPIARALLTPDYLPVLVLLKLELTAFGCTVFWRLRHRTSSEFAVWGVVLVYLLLAVRWSDYTQIVAESAETGAGEPAIVASAN